MLRDRPALALRHAVALGLAQGPTELLPVSSSAHTTLIPFLLGWPYAELDAGLRKSFEVALHAGASLALLLRRRELFGGASLARPRAAIIVLASAPPACVGYTLERPIERRLGGPLQIARGLVAGALAMAIADTRPASRALRQAGACDGLALGLAQAIALAPGISRNGATLAAARARGFARRDAQALSWHAALPVMFAAAALRGARMARHGPPEGAGGALAAGGAVAFCSTLASVRLLRGTARGGRALMPYALYRCLLAAVVAGRLAKRARIDCT